ncbi:MAG: hypothetical protein CBD47_04700 [Synechococcus sp. TMED187]|nr:MAG: hypothetical protein CBD47_04700 [Synechococcus sp. TMED187]
MQLLDAVGAVVQHLVRALDREPPLLDVERLLLRVDLLAQRLLRIELGLPLLLLRSSGRLDRVRPLRLALVRELLQAVALEPTLVRQPRLAPLRLCPEPDVRQLLGAHDRHPVAHRRGHRAGHLDCGLVRGAKERLVDEGRAGVQRAVVGWHCCGTAPAPT